VIGFGRAMTHSALHMTHPLRMRHMQPIDFVSAMTHMTHMTHFTGNLLLYMHIGPYFFSLCKYIEKMRHMCHQQRIPMLEQMVRL
jgi:hypothetical protein